MTTCLGKSCSFGLPRVPFVNCCQFMYLVISLLVLRAGYEIWSYQFLIIAYLFTLKYMTASSCMSNINGLIVSMYKITDRIKIRNKSCFCSCRHDTWLISLLLAAFRDRRCFRTKVNIDVVVCKTLWKKSICIKLINETDVYIVICETWFNVHIKSSDLYIVIFSM